MPREWVGTMARVSTLTLGLFLFVVTEGAALQSSANLTATANVQQPITVAGTTPLDFQTVFPGITKTVTVTSPTAGLFTISGQGSTPVNLSLTLPTTLISGGNNLPIGAWTGYRNSTSSAGSGGTAFTPVNGANGSLALSAGGAGYLFLGATVTPTVSLPAGTYTNTITLTVTY